MAKKAKRRLKPADDPSFVKRADDPNAVKPADDPNFVKSADEELLCPNCGTELPDEVANFCPNCGAEQGPGATTEELTQPPDEGPPRGGPKGPSRRPEGPFRRPSGPSGG